MNKLTKIIYSILGGCNLGMQIFMPLAVALISINFFTLNNYQTAALLIVAFGASLFSAIRFIEE